MSDGVDFTMSMTARPSAETEGSIREVAEVYVNEKSADWIWKPPYWVKVTSLLRDGYNSGL